MAALVVTRRSLAVRSSVFLIAAASCTHGITSPPNGGVRPAFRRTFPDRIAATVRGTLEQWGDNWRRDLARAAAWAFL